MNVLVAVRIVLTPFRVAWNVVALPPGFQYDPPNSTEANACSW